MKSVLFALVACAPLFAGPARPLPPAQGWAKFMGIARFEPGQGALRIAEVRPASFANVIGLREGDAIVALNDFPTADAAAFENVAAWFAANQPVRWRFGVVRDGVDEQIVVTPAPGFSCDPLKLIGCGPLPKR